MSIEVYKPDTHIATLGLIELKGWVSITQTRRRPRFSHRIGILGEPFVQYSRDNTNIYTLTIFQKSPSIADLNKLLYTQKTGTIITPFTLIERSPIAEINPIFGNKEKRVSPIAMLEDEPAAGYAQNAAAWQFNIVAFNETTLYI